MENETGNQCQEIARITLPWGGQLLNYCPVHANKIVLLGQAIGNPIKAQLLSPTASYQCECKNDPLTEEEKKLNATFGA